MRRSRRERGKPSPPAAVGDLAGDLAGDRAGEHQRVSGSGDAVARVLTARTPRFEMTVGAFLARQRAGALHEGPRAELVDGKVVAATQIDPNEAAALVDLTRAFAVADLADHGVDVLPWAPLRLGPIDLVRTALVLLPGPAYFDLHSLEPWAARQRRDAGAGTGGSYDPAGTLLVVETVRAGSEQRERLARLAAAGARDVWLLDVRRGWVESYRSPWRGEYRSRTLWYPGEAVPVSTLDGVTVQALVPP